MPSSVPAVAPNSDETMFAFVCHLVSLLCSSVLLGIVVPIVVLAINKDSDFVRSHAKESLNFQITLLIWVGVSALLCLVIIGFVMLAFVAVMALILPIIACVNALSGNLYRYPLTIHFIK